MSEDQDGVLNTSRCYALVEHARELSTLGSELSAGDVCLAVRALADAVEEILDAVLIVRSVPKAGL